MIVVDNRVRVPAEIIGQLSEEKLEELKQVCTYTNPDFQKWLWHRRGFMPPKEICTWKKERGGNYSFPRGRLQAVLSALGVVEWKDCREEGLLDVPVVWQGPEPRPYQHRLVRSAVEHDGGIWRSRPGSGKTLGGIYCVSVVQRKSLVIVPTTSIFEQWVRDVKLFLGVTAGEVGDGKFRIDSPFVVATQKSALNRIEELAAAGFGTVIADEVQMFAKNTFGKVVDLLPARVRLGVSGDEHRADKKEFAIYDWFGEHVEEVTAEEIAPYQSEPEIRIVLTEFDAPWWQRLQPDERYESRGRLIEEISENAERNRFIAKLAGEIVATGEQVLILAERVEHCRRIETECVTIARTALLSADVKRSFKANKGIFAAGDARIAVGTYKAVGVGFEAHRALSRGILASPVAGNDKSKMQVRQFASRVARDAKGAKIAYYLLDERVFGRQPARLLGRWFKKVSIVRGHDLVPVKQWLKEDSREEEIRASGTDSPQDVDELFK